MRIDGYLPLRDYAVIGDGRTSALVGRDGSIDWLCLPNVDSPPVFDRILDADAAAASSCGPRSLRGRAPLPRRHERARDDFPHRVRVGARDRRDDAPRQPPLAPLRELVRVVDGLEGRVPMRWRFEPRSTSGGARFDDAAAGRRRRRERQGRARTLDVGRRRRRFDRRRRRVTARPLALTHAHTEPLVLPGARRVEHRLEGPRAFWPDWSARARPTTGRGATLSSAARSR